uniref:aspartate transaminase n=1 Tax=Salvator merianae TaxID=96440 RepID=A0A8D0KNN8_SALMN
MGTLSVFLDVPLAPSTDIPLDAYKADPSSLKVCLGHADTDEVWIPPVVKRILLQIPEDPTLNHEYLPELGILEFTTAAMKLVIGKESRALLDNRVMAAGIQTIGGTGAVWTGAEFLHRWYKPSNCTPTTVLLAEHHLENLGCIFQVAGFTDIRTYRYWNPERLTVDTVSFLMELQSAPKGSIVFLHAPEEISLTPKQWKQVSTVMAERHLFPFFDVPAQGLASGNLDRDAWAVRHFVDRGFEILCAQSFSRIFGLYDERIGNLIVVTKNNQTLIKILSQLAKQISVTWLGPTSLGARVISMVLTSPALLYEWKQSLKALVKRIMLVREKLKEKLRILGTPGSWEHLTAQSGVYSFIGLLPSQVEFLAKEKHIYLLSNGQINICSINAKNLDYVAQSIHEAIMSTSHQDQSVTVRIYSSPTHVSKSESFY